MKKINTLFIGILSLMLIPLTSWGQRYLTETFPEVQVTSDLTYGVNATILLLPVVGQAIPEALKFDFYEPKNDDETERPLVILIHTGNFLPIQLNQSTTGARTDSVNVEIAHRLAKLGYCVAAIDYRLGWNPTAETQPERALGLIQAAYRGIQDTRTAIRYFKKDYVENENSYGVDTSRIVVWGIGTGGYVSLAAATFDKFIEVATTTTPPGKFLTDLDGNPATLEPMVAPPYNGDIYGTSVGVTPPTGLPPLPPNDTLCYPNHVGYSSAFQLCVNMGGALADISWLEDGDVPMITYQVPTDPFAPYESAVLIVPTTGDPIVEVQGGHQVATKANDLGNNDVFSGVDDAFPDFKVYTDGAKAGSASANHDYEEGLYPFIRATNIYGQEEGDPWTWWDPAIWSAIAHPSGLGSYHQVGLFNNANMSATKGRLYVDTIMGYFAPRAYLALNLTVGTEELLNDNQIKVNVSPNPAPDFVLVESPAEHPIQSLQVYDFNGRLVQNLQNIQNNLVRVDRNGVPPGLYLVKLKFEEGVIAKKVVFK